MIISKVKPANHLVYVFHSNLDSFILFNYHCLYLEETNSEIKEEENVKQISKKLKNKETK